MRSKPEFEQYVLEKSRQKIAVRKKRRNIIISSTAAFAVILGAFAAFNASKLNDAPAQNYAAGTTNAETIYSTVSQGINNITDEAAENVVSQITESSDSIEKYECENDGSVSKNGEQLFSDEFANSHDRNELPDYITITVGCIIYPKIDSAERIEEICSATENLTKNNISDSASAETDIYIDFHYDNSDNESASLHISGNKLYIEEEFLCYITDDYLTFIDKCCHDA